MVAVRRRVERDVGAVQVVRRPGLKRGGTARRVAFEVVRNPPVGREATAEVDERPHRCRGPDGRVVRVDRNRVAADVDADAIAEHGRGTRRLSGVRTSVRDLGGTHGQTESDCDSDNHLDELRLDLQFVLHVFLCLLCCGLASKL